MAATDDGRESPKEESEENLWSAILNDVGSSTRKRKENTKTLLVLGDVNSGKSVLIDKLCQISKSFPIGGKFPLSCCSLEYRFIDVQDEETDDLVDRMGVWILDGVVWHSQLLSFVLKKETLPHTMVMIVADMSQPWTIMESLQRWADVVRKHIDSLMVPTSELKDMEANIVRQFQSYLDPDVPPVTTTTASQEDEGDSVALPLGEMTLTHNLGIPIIVVCSKSDGITNLEKNYGYKEEHSDFIQQHIRKFCLHYGAALVYTSAREERNLSILHQYILHRAYNLPFKESASVVDRDAIFIPSGWDSEKKINILYDQTKGFTPTDAYESIIQPPKTAGTESDAGEVEAKDDQVFLMTQQVHINKSPKPPSTPPLAQKEMRSPASSGRPVPSKVGPEGGDGKSNVPSETVLSAFFSNLLSKKQPSAKVSTARPVVHAEAAAQLDKMENKKQTPKA